ncbi:MAG: 50S ribosomal protein L18 [Saprospiraceae bacterium]|nr:50S ribosomal protein L18 [Bacteroidia bacterium]NNE16054.1 50S ribosomal protein L18 [Saprospiraceae bacterium]NNL91261.1 50S ribosomal protein L18 [Saprospiraceae bacterium]
MGISIKPKQKIKYRIRKKINGTPDAPRLSVFRSNKNIYCQIIDDVNGVTLASANSKTLGLGSNKDSAVAVGKLIAERAVSKNISKVVFDRNGNLYHGRIKALADAAREGGLKF